MYRPGPSVRLLDACHPRRQAAERHPALAPLILASPALVDALDTGGDLRAGIRSLGVEIGEDALDRVGVLPVAADAQDLIGLLRNAASCPASWIPGDAAGATDFLAVSKAVDRMVALDATLRRDVLMRSVNGCATAMIDRVRERWHGAVRYARHPREAFDWGVVHASHAAWCCQEALGLARRPDARPGYGAWDPQPDPCFVRALYAERTIEAVANIGCAHSIRDARREAAHLRDDPAADDLAGERAFWLGWRGNEERLLRAVRDLVQRRIAYRGDERLGNWIRGGSPDFDPCADAWPGLVPPLTYTVGPPDPRGFPETVP